MLKNSFTTFILSELECQFEIMFEYLLKYKYVATGHEIIRFNNNSGIIHNLTTASIDICYHY